MKIKTLPSLIVASLAAVLFLTSFQKESVRICKNGEAVSRIVIPSDPTEVEKHASVVLQNYLHQITGANFEIVSDDTPAKKNDIQIGQVNRPEIAELDLAELEEDGYVILTRNDRLSITGGSEKGTLYGVYGFLEKYLGCRKYTSKVSIVPALFNISVSNIYDKQIPVFKFREVLYRDVYHPEYMEWHGLDNHGSYNLEGDWGNWCHTTHSLVPPEKYCASNPELFSMIDGERLCSAEKHNVGDICFSSEAAFEIAYESLKAFIDDRPEITYWSVSQMDNAQYCRCPICQNAYDEHGSTQGSILPFVNKMARKFPDKIISTLAYWYSTRPPTGIPVEKNVNIMLCNIGSPRHIPIEEGDSAFCADLEAWHKIHDNFLIWDYTIQFANLLAPFPNIRTLQPNLQYLNRNGVVAMFEQANRDNGGEFCELKAYILAKLMWDPYQDLDAIMDDFLNGYYGAAGKYIREYIDLMHDSMEETGASLSIFGRPWDNRDTFLSVEMIKRYYSILDRAEEVVSDYPDLRFRVKTVRMQIDYAVLDIAKGEVTGERGALTEEDGLRIPKKEIQKLLHVFVSMCDLNNVTRIHEWHTPPREYAKQYNEFLKENTGEVNEFWGDGEPFFEVQKIFSDERFPNVIVAGDGTVVTSWGRENFRVRRSEDGGESWGPEITVANPGFQGGGTTVDESSGDIMVFVEGEHPPSPIRFYRSKDHGLSWKQEEVVIKANSLGHIPSMHMNEHGITLKHGEYAGRLIRPTRYYDKGNDRAYWDNHYTNAIFSDDGGKTWQASEPFPAMGTGEATIAELSDGTLYYNSRRHRSTDGLNPRMRHIARSYDGGLTWKDLSVSEVLPDGAQHRDYGLMAGLVKLPVEGDDILLFSNIESEEGRHHGTVWASFDGGLTWPVKRLVDEGSFAYSSLAAGRKGTPSEGMIYLFYESDGGAKMARFNLSWLTEDKKW